MSCGKSKHKTIKDFPEEYQELLFRLDAKNEVLNQLLMFESMREKRIANGESYYGGSWTADIHRITMGVVELTSQLPEDVKIDYIKYRHIQDLYHMASMHMYDEKFDEAKDCWAKARSLECCGGSNCEC